LGIAARNLVLSVELGLRLYSISTGGQQEHHTVTQARSDGVIKLARTAGRNAASSHPQASLEAATLLNDY